MMKRASWVFGFTTVLTLGTGVVGAPRLASADATPLDAISLDAISLDTTAAVSGHWQTLDDKTGQPGAIIRTWVQDGKLNGAIEKILKKDSPPNPKCEKCSGYFKDKPIVGLTFMWGLAPDGDEWSGGTILDPESGDTYHCKAKPVAGDKLEVRGFVGISAFGRTQTWTRVH